MSAGNSEAVRDLVVIGGSAGALPALSKLLPELEPNFPAPIIVVIHRGAGSSDLAGAIGRSSPLSVIEPQDHAELEPGCVYVAPFDCHVIAGGDHLHLRRGPRENGFRPSIDPLFRSAAVFLGHRTIGVILSGYLDDGASGLRALKQCGGLAFVQDPAEAQSPDMPRAAISSVGEPDVVAGPAALGRALNRLAGTPASGRIEAPNDVKIEVLIAGLKEASMSNEERIGTLTPYSCPDCQGVLWEIEDGPLLRYRCHTGHAYTARSLTEAQAEALERRMYETLKEHRERAGFLRRLAERDLSNRAHWEDRAKDYDRDAQVMEQMILQRNESSAAPSMPSH